jgi:hypothetical protein
MAFDLRGKRCIRNSAFGRGNRVDVLWARVMLSEVVLALPRVENAANPVPLWLLHWMEARQDILQHTISLRLSLGGPVKHWPGLRLPSLQTVSLRLTEPDLETCELLGSAISDLRPTVQLVSLRLRWHHQRSRLRPPDLESFALQLAPFQGSLQNVLVLQGLGHGWTWPYQPACVTTTFPRVHSLELVDCHFDGTGLDALLKHLPGVTSLCRANRAREAFVFLPATTPVEHICVRFLQGGAWPFLALPHGIQHTALMRLEYYDPPHHKLSALPSSLVTFQLVCDYQHLTGELDSSIANDLADGVLPQLRHLRIEAEGEDGERGESLPLTKAECEHRGVVLVLARRARLRRPEWWRVEQARPSVGREGALRGYKVGPHTRLP